MQILFRFCWSRRRTGSQQSRSRRNPAKREGRWAYCHEEREGNIARRPVREKLRRGTAGRAAHEDQADPLHRAEVENDAQQEGEERHEKALREDAQERGLPACQRGLRLHLVNGGSHAKDHEYYHDREQRPKGRVPVLWRCLHSGEGSEQDRKGQSFGDISTFIEVSFHNLDF